LSLLPLPLHHGSNSGFLGLLPLPLPTTPPDKPSLLQTPNRMEQDGKTSSSKHKD